MITEFCQPEIEEIIPNEPRPVLFDTEKDFEVSEFDSFLIAASAVLVAEHEKIKEFLCFEDFCMAVFLELKNN